MKLHGKREYVDSKNVNDVLKLPSLFHRNKISDTRSKFETAKPEIAMSLHLSPGKLTLSNTVATKRPIRANLSEVAAQKKRVESSVGASFLLGVFRSIKE